MRNLQQINGLFLASKIDQLFIGIGMNIRKLEKLKRSTREAK
ncbi:hypothetical protein P20495_4062 [Pseudoalteromonas sp. BSi20495]|nr:hypothetical protein P20495_4062 [Pseudoalteromonas sp. BSi20495]